MNEIIHEQKLKLSEEQLRGPDQPDYELDITKLNANFQEKAQQLKQEELEAKEQIQDLEEMISSEERQIVSL